MNKFETNLSEGSVLKRLIFFAMPFLVSNVIQSLYNVADMLIVGNFSGTVSMSGVNIGGQITFILTNIVIGFCIGGTVLIAQNIGYGNRKVVATTTATLITTLLSLSVIITLLMVWLKDPVLRLIKTPPESFAESSRYLLVTVLGTVFIFGYNALSAILRGMGDSKRPLYFVTIACVTNILLDLLLVAQFKMGALGAAVATVISQALSMILCIIYLRKNNFIFDFRPSSFKIDLPTLGKITRIGFPTSVQNATTSLSFLIITTLVNVVGGVNASAAVGVVGKFNGFAIMPSVALASSVSTIAAQNIGAGEWERAKKTCKLGTLMAAAICVLIFTVVQLCPGAILAVFDDNPEMISHGVPYFRTFSIDYLIVPFVFCLNGLFIGAGHTTFSLISNMMGSIFLRAPMAAILGISCDMGLSGLGLGAPLASLGSLFLSLWFYLSGRWMHNAIKLER